jgi:hypothetical protein
MVTMMTDSLWGAVLIHAAADLFLFFAMFANAKFTAIGE